MNNNDYTLFFITMALFNTNIGLMNVEKNTEQYERQLSIEQKLDKLINLLEDKK